MLKHIWIEQEKHQVYGSYVLDFINHHPLNNGKIVFEITDNKQLANLHYAHAADSDFPQIIHIPALNMFFRQSKVSNRALTINTYHAKPQNVHAIEGGSHGLRDFFDGQSFAFDWIETIFFHISRYEEFHYDAFQRNRWDMMPEKEQILVKHKLHHIPVVDELVNAILQSLGIVVELPVTSIYWSHDVDYFSRKRGFLNSMKKFLSFLKYGAHLGKAFSIAFLEKHSKFQNFSFLVDDKNGTEKRIYFHVGGDHEFDPEREIDRNLYIRTLADEALGKGYRIGIHPSFMAATNAPLFQEEKTLLESVIGSNITLSRQHFLHFDFHKTLSILEENGIAEDSSLGYNEHIGFRCGTGFDYALFNWHTKSKSSVIERPLIWMDSAQRYEVKMDSKLFNSKAIKFLDANKLGTQININMHNNYWVDYPIYGIDLKKLVQEIRNK